MTSMIWQDITDAAVPLGALIIGLIGGYTFRRLLGHWQAEAVERQAQLRSQEADNEIKARLKEADIQARAEVVKAREEFEKTTKTRRNELEDLEKRLTQREETIQKKNDEIEKKNDLLKIAKEVISEEQTRLETEKKKAADTLYTLAGMTHDEARRTVITRAEQEIQSETGAMIRRIQEEAKANADREARAIVATAIQRCAVSHASELVTSTVPLADDELKGRIIGREGRNVRTLENLTGASILLDDTPDVIVISCFDPIRREVARKALEILIADGRVHPTRIEEVVEHVQSELQETIRQAGEDACFEANVQGVEPSLIRTLGRLRFRTSFTQNVLRHAIEVANLMGLMASELGLNPTLARRAGLFHDIGKSVDQDREGTHSAIGADILRQAGESPVVVNTAAAHHGDVEAESLYPTLCSAADAISGSRPGARSEATAIYMKRLEDLERLAAAFPGVKKSFAIQAGREIRVIVSPEEITDNKAMLLARDIARKIETELLYPGQIRVVVSRETRCIEYAK